MTCKDNETGVCEDANVSTCSPFQLTKTVENCLISSYVEENLNIGGSDVNLYKLLGVHEQGQLVDVAGNGHPLASGSQPAYPASNAFDKFTSEWRSSHKGVDVSTNSYIGYNFGSIKLDNSREKYGIPTYIKFNVSMIKIKQSPNKKNRVTRARIERSYDNEIWYGVALVDLPDDGELNTVSFKKSAPSGHWRVRALDFNGGPLDYWGVQALQLLEFDVTDINNIEDPIFLENRSRDYLDEPIPLKGSYDLLDTQSELTRFGIELPTQSYYLTISFAACVKYLSRPVVVGDIIELPSETQFSANLVPIKKFLEIIDVGWSTEGFTPGWKPTLLRVIAQPMLASQETQDIVGDLGGSLDDLDTMIVDFNNNEEGLSDHKYIQNSLDFDHTLKAEANTDTPERGADTDQIHVFSDDAIDSAASQNVNNLNALNPDERALYIEDGLPKNGEPYTIGTKLPASPIDGDFHRLTYEGLAADIPPRLFRFSGVKNSWIYLETDRRKEFNNTRPMLQEYINSSTSIPTSKVNK